MRELIQKLERRHAELCEEYKELPLEGPQRGMLFRHLMTLEDILTFLKSSSIEEAGVLKGQGAIDALRRMFRDDL